MTDVEERALRNHVMERRPSETQIKPKNTTQAQLIDFEGEFNPKFDRALERLGLASCGFAYSVVAVLGCQSSGKSTLLNTMFGTCFSEMNAMQGRSQTTKGIWASRDKQANVLVIDVEGTDSKERGEDRLTFEHRASLFSLAIADVVVVNMWYTDLGRYSASNYGLLKTVLAVNLELFGQEKSRKKTTLLFVIRDHSPEVTPLFVLEKMLFNDLTEIWNSIKKPTALDGSRASDFFNFEFEGLSSRVTQRHLFDQQVESLRERYFKSIAPGEYSRRIPADGFVYFAKSIWNTILKSAELDIPSQKEMVANYRCDEIRSAALAVAVPLIRSCTSNVKRLIEEGIAQKAVTEALRIYHGEAWRYQDTAYEAKKSQLLESLYLELQEPMQRHLNAKRQELVKTARNQILQLCRKNDFEDFKLRTGEPVTTLWETLAERCKAWRDKISREMDGICNELSLEFTVEIEDEAQPLTEKISHSLDSQIIRANLDENLDEIVAATAENEFTEFKSFLRYNADSMREEICVLFKTAEIDQKSFWMKVSDFLANKSEYYHQAFGPSLIGIKSLNASSTTSIGVSEPDDELMVLMTSAVRDSLVARLDWLPGQIHDRFKKFFEEDENGVPHFWPGMTQEKISDCYIRAKKIAEKLLPVLETFQVDWQRLLKNQADVPVVKKRLTNFAIMSQSKMEEIREQAARRMLKSCQEAQFIQATGGKFTTPSWWWWGLLMILGWNEALAVLRSPLTVFLSITVATILLAAYYTKNLNILTHFVRSGFSMALGVVLPVLATFQEPSARNLSFPNTNSEENERTDS